MLRASTGKWFCQCCNSKDGLYIVALRYKYCKDCLYNCKHEHPSDPQLNLFNLMKNVLVNKASTVE